MESSPEQIHINNLRTATGLFGLYATVCATVSTILLSTGEYAPGFYALGWSAFAGYMSRQSFKELKPK